MDKELQSHTIEVFEGTSKELIKARDVYINGPGFEEIEDMTPSTKLILSNNKSQIVYKENIKVEDKNISLLRSRFLSVDDILLTARAFSNTLTHIIKYLEDRGYKNIYQCILLHTYDGDWNDIILYMEK